MGRRFCRVWWATAEKALLVGLRFYFFLYKKEYILSHKGFRSKMWNKLFHYPLALILDGFQPLLMVGMSRRSFYLKTFNNLKQNKNMKAAFITVEGICNYFPFDLLL